jgi:hypothetical protein
MSSKKSKTVTKNLIHDCHLQENIRSNQLTRKLQIKHKPFTSKQKAFIDIALNEDTKMMFIQGPAGCAKDR